MKHPMLFALVISSLLYLVACTTAELPPTPTPPQTPILSTSTPIPPTEPPVLPTATLTTTPTEIALEFPTGEFYNGSWSANLYLEEDGSYRIIWETGEHGCRGTYAVNGNQITLSPDVPCTEQGVYEWMFDGEILFFEAIEDTCNIRIQAFDVKTGYKKQ